MNILKIFIIILALSPIHIFARGQLIEICGIDGAGKTTFAQDLKEALILKGRKAVIMRPISGDPEYLKKINSLVKKCDIQTKQRIDSFKSEYFILDVLANQAVIENYLEQDIDVICDRYTFSFITYRTCFKQTQERDFPLLQECLKADHIFLMTIPIDKALERIQKRDIQSAHENREFLSQAQYLFLKNAENYPKLSFLNGLNQREENVITAIERIIS